VTTDTRQNHDSLVRHEFRFERPFDVMWRPLGVTPANAYVEVDDQMLTARFGPWCVETTLANVAAARVTGPYRWYRVIGPPRVSLVDRGLTFASNTREGVCIRFRTPVAGALPSSVLRHPGLTVTVEDPVALAELLSTIASATVPGPRGLEETEASLHDELDGLTASELRTRAAALGLSGTSHMKRAELVELLEDAPVSGSPGGGSGFT
jgi:hypothetical protein